VLPVFPEHFQEKCKAFTQEKQFSGLFSDPAPVCLETGRDRKLNHFRFIWIIEGDLAAVLSGKFVAGCI